MAGEIKIDPLALERMLASIRMLKEGSPGILTAGMDSPPDPPALEAFARAHTAASSLNNTTVDRWEWSGVNPDSIRVTDPAGSIQVNIPALLPEHPNCPRLSVPLHPIDENNAPVTGERQYYAPLLVRRGGTWKTRPDIRNHKITGYVGQPSNVKEIGFDKAESMTLEEVVASHPREDEGGLLLQALTGKNVPVVDVVPVIPFSADQKYKPEFSIKLDVRDLPHPSYAVYIVSQDRLVYRIRLHGDRNTPIEVGIISDQAKKDLNWNPMPKDQIPDELAPIIPSSSGQIKLIVVPIRKPRPSISTLDYLSSRSPDSYARKSYFDPTANRSSGSVSGTYLETGTGGKASGSLYKGDLIVPRDVDAIIYDIRPIALTPNRIERLAPGELAGGLTSIPEPSVN